VLVGNIRSPIALIVDQLVDEREAVVKALGPIFQQHRLLNGAIQLGDGSLVLLLNPHQLAREVGSSVQRSITHHTAPRRAPHLLVADDSFTTRELIKSILQSAGYSITVATDGVDALDKLQRDTYDLVVSDVEMPRLNGFELTSRIRQESALHTLPVILVTSLPSDDHRRQGLEAGAQAYIVKSQFDQDNLLDTIQQLLGHEG
jgi:two-component system chemotaxis sensor kinase CheA